MGAELLEARTLAVEEHMVLRLGLTAHEGGRHLIQDADCSERPLFPLLNTAMTELLRTAGLHLKMTSIKVCYGKVSSTALTRGKIGTAAVLALVGGGRRLCPTPRWY